MYIGLGHRTHNYERHTPFLYTLSKDFKTSVMGEDIETGKTVVEDPLSIYEEDGKILTHKHGYPQFYTQILFEKGKQEIYIKTVLNDEEGISKISTCKKIEKFEKES